MTTCDTACAACLFSVDLQCTSFTQQLSSASASTVEDLLFIACNECSACWDALIEFDQSNTHLLFDRIDLSQSACENSTQQHAAQHEELLQQLIQTAVVADNGHAAVSLLDSASLTRLISERSLLTVPDKLWALLC